MFPKLIFRNRLRKIERFLELDSLGNNGEKFIDISHANLSEHLPFCFWLAVGNVWMYWHRPHTIYLEELY
jgi:hypothetical protein